MGDGCTLASFAPRTYLTYSRILDAEYAFEKAFPESPPKSEKEIWKVYSISSRTTYSRANTNTNTKKIYFLLLRHPAIQFITQLCEIQSSYLMMARREK
jgi:hypothetical protein